MNDFGVVTKIQKYAIHDGPGIRTLVFLKGCPLRCLWCCNPESWNPNPEITFNKQKCVDCRTCLKVCPTKSIKVDAKGNKIVEKKNCNLCIRCVAICKRKAIELVGRYMTVQNVVEIVEKDMHFYTASGGGITLSGGEPTFQYEFSKKLLQECKKRGINTAIETNGHCEEKRLIGLSEFTDLFLYDIKVLEGNKHLKLIGVRNDIILKNLSALAKLGKKIIIRYPLIPKNNDKDEDISALADLVLDLHSEYGVIEELAILPYHRYGTYKYALLGIDYRLRKLKPHTDCQISGFKEKLSGLLDTKVKIGG
jgi:pyruvate formate lyase activating enzyme